MEMTKATGQSILELVVKNNLVNVPKIIEVVDFGNGQIDDKDWGKFKVRDVEEFEALKKIGKEGTRNNRQIIEIWRSRFECFYWQKAFDGKF